MLFQDGPSARSAMKNALVKFQGPEHHRLFLLTPPRQSYQLRERGPIMKTSGMCLFALLACQQTHPVWKMTPCTFPFGLASFLSMPQVELIVIVAPLTAGSLLPCSSVHMTAWAKHANCLVLGWKHQRQQWLNLIVENSWMLESSFWLQAKHIWLKGPGLHPSSAVVFQPASATVFFFSSRGGKHQGAGCFMHAVRSCPITREWAVPSHRWNK